MHDRRSDAPKPRPRGSTQGYAEPEHQYEQRLALRERSDRAEAMRVLVAEQQGEALGW